MGSGLGKKWSAILVILTTPIFNNLNLQWSIITFKKWFKFLTSKDNIFCVYRHMYIYTHISYMYKFINVYKYGKGDGKESIIQRKNLKF